MNFQINHAEVHYNIFPPSLYIQPIYAKPSLVPPDYANWDFCIIAQTNLFYLRYIIFTLWNWKHSIKSHFTYVSSMKLSLNSPAHSNLFFFFEFLKPMPKTWLFICSCWRSITRLKVTYGFKSTVTIFSEPKKWVNLFWQSTLMWGCSRKAQRCCWHMDIPSHRASKI